MLSMFGSKCKSSVLTLMPVNKFSIVFCNALALYMPLVCTVSWLYFTKLPRGVIFCLACVYFCGLAVTSILLNLAEVPTFPIEITLGRLSVDIIRCIMLFSSELRNMF